MKKNTINTTIDTTISISIILSILLFQRFNEFRNFIIMVKFICSILIYNLVKTSNFSNRMNMKIVYMENS